MFDFLNQSLMRFRQCFSREATFRWFAILVITFMLREDHLGVTSALRMLPLDPGCYHTVLHFYRSAAYSVTGLRTCWCQLVRDSGAAYIMEGRAVLVGDGVKQSKEGSRMPGVKKLHQDSEDSSKGEYIFGHLFGAVGIVVGNAAHSLCLPLMMGIRDGLHTAAGWEGSTVPSDSHVVQMVVDGYEAAKHIGQSIFVLDRYFLTVPALEKLRQLNGGSGGRLLEVVTKAKKNCVAYTLPATKTGKRGRPRKKGDPVRLMELFKEPGAFEKATVRMYGKEREVHCLSRDLLWGQGLYQELRFVLVVYEGMTSILVSTDLSLTPEAIIEIYALRFSIESCFREFKQQFGGFCYHFWVKGLEKLNRYKKKDEPDQLSHVTGAQSQAKVLQAIEATERFVQVACIAMGLVQLMLLREGDTRKIQGLRYTRTRSEGKVSEATMMYYLRRTLLLGLSSRTDLRITQLIQSIFSNGESQDKAA